MIILRHRLPRRALGFNGGIGDDIMATSVLRELHARGERRIWMITPNPEIFAHSPYGASALPESQAVRKILQRLSIPIESLLYESRDPHLDRSQPPDQHLIAVMCRLAKITGSVRLKPEIFLTKAERSLSNFSERRVVIQSSALGARFPMLNKEWGPERFQKVVDALQTRFDFVQIGSVSDPSLAHTRDCRGRMTLRQTAGLLANSHLFVGLVGGMMHLARAVDCPAVIVYGGRETPSQSGYSCNENITCEPLPCSPCWRWNACDFERVCLTSIQPQTVVDAIIRASERRRELLPNETVELRQDPDVSFPRVINYNPLAPTKPYRV